MDSVYSAFHVSFQNKQATYPDKWPFFLFISRQEELNVMDKKTTLKLNKEFKRLYFKGKSAVHPLIVTYACKNRLGRNRIGITVTKKVGKAVCRNRCKRIIRAAFYQVNPSIEQGWDFVFVARARTPQAKSTELVPVLKKQILNLTSPDSQKRDTTGKRQQKSVKKKDKS